jgi:hypothetical protein
VTYLLTFLYSIYASCERQQRKESRDFFHVCAVDHPGQQLLLCDADVALCQYWWWESDGFLFSPLSFSRDVCSRMWPPTDYQKDRQPWVYFFFYIHFLFSLVIIWDLISRSLHRRPAGGALDCPIVPTTRLSVVEMMRTLFLLPPGIHLNVMTSCYWWDRWTIKSYTHHHPHSARIINHWTCQHERVVGDDDGPLLCFYHHQWIFQCGSRGWVMGAGGGGILLREEKLDLTECCSVSLQFERGRIVLASWICHGKDERRPGARGDVGKRVGNLLIKPLEGTAPYIAGGLGGARSTIGGCWW